MVWLTGTDTPLILMLIGAPVEMKMSDAFLSAMIWNSRFIADICCPLVATSPSLIPPQQVVEACLGAGPGVYLFYNHCTVKAVLAVGGGNIAGDDHRARRYAAVKDLPGRPVEDFGALADEYAHRDDAVFLDHHALHHLRAGADKAVVLDDGR